MDGRPTNGPPGRVESFDASLVDRIDFEIASDKRGICYVRA